MRDGRAFRLPVREAKTRCLRAEQQAQDDEKVQARFYSLRYAATAEAVSFFASSRAQFMNARKGWVRVRPLGQTSQ